MHGRCLFLSFSFLLYILVLLHLQESTSGDVVSLLFLGGGAVIGCIPLAHRLCNLGKRRAPEIDQIFLSLFFLFSHFNAFSVRCTAGNWRRAGGEVGHPSRISGLVLKQEQVFQSDQAWQAAWVRCWWSIWPLLISAPAVAAIALQKQARSEFFFILVLYSLPPSNVQAQSV